MHRLSRRRRTPIFSAPLLLAVTLTTPMGTGCVTTSTAMGHVRDSMALGDEAEAESWLREAMRDPATADEAKAQLEALLLRRAKGIPDGTHADTERENIYEEILRIAPHSTEARLSLGRMYMRSDRHGEALELLTDDDACLGCTTLAAVVLFERGQAALQTGRWAEAARDLDEAFIRGGDVAALFSKTEAYTRGRHGTAGEAIASLQQARAKMDVNVPGQLNSYVVARRAIAVEAARSGDISGVEQALILDDPRPLSADAALLEDFSLRLAVAQGEIDGGFYDDGIRRAAGVFVDARQTDKAEVLARVRDYMVQLFALRAAEQIKRGEGKEAAEGLEPALRIDPDNGVIRLQQVLAVATFSTKRAKSILDDIDESTPGYDRTKAIFYTIRARDRLEAQQYTAAATDLNRARALDPNLLEVRLGRAEYMAATRFSGLTRDAAREFRDIGEFDYPENRVNRYAQALAQIAFIRDHWDCAAKADPLRGPRFEDRMETLEANIRSFYPYGVDWRADEKSQLIFGNDSDTPVQVQVAGASKGGPATVEVPAGGQADLVIDQPSYVRVGTPRGEFGLFAEPGVRIEVAAQGPAAGRP